MEARRHARWGALALTLLLLAGPAAALDGPDCRPHTNCTFDDFNSSEEYFFTVNGRQLIIQYFEKKKQMKVTCDQVGTGEAAHAADEPALPALPAPAALDLVELVGCRPPAGAYADALRALKVSAVARLSLRSVPERPSLTRAHLSGLDALSELWLDPGTRASRPLRPEPDFLASLTELRSLRLYRVEAPRALLSLPATLERLELHETALAAAERELRAAPEPALRDAATRWLARLTELRELTLVEQYRKDRLTPPPLAKLRRLRNATLRVPLGPLPPRWLAGSGLERLSLVSCGLSDLSMFAFDGTNLTELNVSQNNLTDLPKGAFGQQEVLRRLDVSGNKLSRSALERALLPADAGPAVVMLPALRELKASNNPLGSLCKSTTIALGNAYSSLPKSLTLLELSATNATRLCTDWLRESDLEVIDLENNDINSLDYNELVMMRPAGAAAAGVRLVLTGNRLLREVTVTRRQVAACVNASKASVEPGDITRARVELALSELHCTCNNAPLRELMQKCPLLTLEDKGPGCTADTKKFLQYEPDELLCEDHQLRCPPGCKCGVNRLSDNAIVVECEHTRLAKSWPGWAAASRASPLALSALDAGLTAVPRVDLVELRAPNNSITALDEADICDTLRVLELQNNRITRVSEAAALRLRGRSVKLAGNPFSCLCRDQAALARLKDANVSDWKELRCGGDGALQGRLLDGLSPDELCHNWVPWVLGSTVAAAVLLAGAAVALWPRLRPHVKQFLFERQLCLDWVLGVDDEVDDPEKTHDAFVSYAYPDHARAVRIVRGLEARGYSTLLHCRDWAPGPAVAEHIARSVLSARRTLLLVSDQYAGSKWALEEFRAAHAHALAARSARLLLLRCGLRAPERLPPDLQLHLRLNTYLDVDDDAFWPKLCCAMPRRREPVAVTVERDEKPRAPPALRAPVPALGEPEEKPPRPNTPPAPRVPTPPPAEPDDEPVHRWVAPAPTPAAAEPGDEPSRPWPTPAPRAAPPPAAPAAAALLQRLLSPARPTPSPVREQPAPAPRPLVDPVG